MSNVATSEQSGDPRPSRRSLLGLDGLNFLTADVRDGLGPYLAVFLKGGQHWQPGPIGIAMAASSVAAALFQIPAGFLSLAGMAAGALLFFALLMPETADRAPATA